MSNSSVEHRNHLIALASLPRMGPRRFAALLGHPADPVHAWELVLAGRAHTIPRVAAVLARDAATVAGSWATAARTIDPALLGEHHRERGIEVAVRGDAGYPTALHDDPEPPALLFSRGDPALASGVSVAIVGTRRCSRYGRDVAFELARDLAGEGVAVVSGLAVGIDAAAHAGALEGCGGAPVAVVASGLDVVYPRRNGPLWRQVEERGVVFSEYPLGVEPQAWRFPARNRLIAALASIVVVVESHAKGGSLYTVDEAARRDRTVMAVPGSIRSPSSRGANDLLADGCAPVRDVDDILVQLGLEPAGPPTERAEAIACTPDALVVLDALGWEPASLEHLAVRTGLPLERLNRALYDLRTSGEVADDGGWFERQSKPARRRA